MAFLFDVNGPIPVTGADVIFHLKTLLKSASWLVTQSSDGGSYSASGDLLLSELSGPNGLLNPYSYFVIAQPAPRTRQLLFQCSTSAPGTGSQWKVKYSPSAGFVGPAIGISPPTSHPADAVSTPSALDEVILVGGGDDITPTFAPLFGTDGGYRVNIIAADTSSNSSFIFWTNTTGSNFVYSVFVLDVLLPGSYVGPDQDPAVLYVTTSPVDSILNTDLTGGVAQAHYGSVFANVYALTFNIGATTFFPVNGGQNQFTGKVDFSPIPYGILAVAGPPSGWKGVSSILFWNSTSRPYGNPYQVGSNPNSYITITGDSTGTNSFVVVPWDGSTPLV